MSLDLRNTKKLALSTFLWVITVFTTFSQDSNECNWEKINELGTIFRDTIYTNSPTITEENQGTVGKPSVTRLDVPYILASKYFDRCLKGLNPEYFINLLGKGNLQELNNIDRSVEFQLEYTMQIYSSSGEDLDPMPGTFYIQFNDKREAVFMYEIAY